MPVASLSAATLRELITGREELALIDLREGGVFAKSHLLFAINCPLSRLELLIEDLVPRRDGRMVLCACAGDGRHCAIGDERLQ
ncbi:MAG: rhodanese-related sulfurtransferase, partial [Rhodospirillales bacterium]|nr:rhodanese-related sulfurtransferase [Rhodospirillales bacterium]